MTQITLENGSVFRATTSPDALQQALGTGSGKIGLQDGDTRQWHWVRAASILAIDGRPWLAHGTAATL
jgi:hypothetical protein